MISNTQISYTTFGPPAGSPAKLRFIVHTTDLYSSSHSHGALALGSTLRVAYQVWDQYWRSEVSQWSPSNWKPTVKAVVAGGATRTSTCGAPSTSTGMGTCTLSLGSEFSSSSDRSVSVTVEGHGIADYVEATVDVQPSDSPRAQVAILHRDPIVNQASLVQTSSQGSVYLVLPQYPLWLGEWFSLRVNANTGPKYFKQLDINVHWDQSIISLGSVYVPNGVFGNNYRIAIEAYKHNSGTVDSASSCNGLCTWQGVLDRRTGGTLLAGNIHALTFEFRLPGNISSASTIIDAVRSDVNFFKHEEDGNYLSLNPPLGNVPVVGCQGLVGATLPTTASVAIVYDTTVALYGSFNGGTVSGTLYNTAALDGSAVSASIDLRRLTSFRSNALGVPGGISCLSHPSTASRCEVSGSTVRVSLQSSHTTGSFYAHLRTEYDSHQADIHFTALYPEIDSMYAEESQLLRIAAAGGCSNTYEGTEVVVQMRFSAPDAPAQSAVVDATQLLASKLRVSSGSSHVRLAGSHVTGVSPGAAVLTVPGFPGFSASISVSDTAVSPTMKVITLDVSTASARQNYGANDGSPAIVHTQQSCSFDKEGDVGYVFSFAVFPSYVRLLSAADVQVTSLLPVSVEVLSPTRMTIPLGASGVCSAAALGSMWLLDESDGCTTGDRRRHPTPLKSQMRLLCACSAPCASP